MSRLPMAGRIDHLLQPGVPSATVEIRLRGGQRIVLHALHPEPPWPGDNSGERDAELLTTGRMVRKVGRATIVMGDLNDGPGSTMHQVLEGSDFTDAWATLRTGVAGFTCCHRSDLSDQIAPFS